MADSSLVNGDGTVKVTIYSEGDVIDDTFQLVSVFVHKKINKIPYAQLTFMDGDVTQKDFSNSNKDTFSPGNTIKINAGYGHEDETIYEGVVVKHGISINSSNSTRLIVELKDPAIKMTVGRKNATFDSKKDSDIIKSIITSYSDLTADVDDTNTTYEQMVQYYATDWDFMMTRAEVNGLLTVVDAGKVSVKAPAADGSEVLNITYGVDLIEFNAELNAESQLSASKGVGWNMDEQKVSEQTGSSTSLNSQGDLTADTLSDVIGLKNYLLQTSVPEADTGILAWSDASLLKAGLSIIQGSMKFQGSAKAKPDSVIAVDCVGNHFNGNVYVSAVKHDISNGNWTTEVEFGLNAEWYSEQKFNITAPPASGLLPGIEGIHTGIVQKLDGDPDGELRIQVQCPLLGDDAQFLWARLATFYGLDQYGAFFIPEIGSEVILGFINNDPRFPVVLGCLYSSKNAAPYELTADNYTKAIVTKGLLKLEFDDEKMITTLETPGGNKIIISDEDKSIVITDQNSNKVELNSDGITLDSPKDITISSQAKITMSGATGIEISSNSDIKISGTNVTETANAAYKASGSATAEVSASGTTTIKGAMVMIN